MYRINKVENKQVPGPARLTTEVAEGLAWTTTTLKGELELRGGVKK